MSRFNEKSKKRPTAPDAVNLAGGTAYSQDAETEFASLLLTSFVDNKFYRSGSDALKRATELIKQLDPEFAAKAAVYTRRVMGMRSISHFVAAQLVPFVKGKNYAKDFFAAIIERPDDMSEIIGALQGATGKSKIRGAARSHALRKGFIKAFEKFDAYQFGKYRGEGKDVKLVDIVNLFHPKTKAKAEVNKVQFLEILKEQKAFLEKQHKPENAAKLVVLTSRIKAIENPEMDSVEFLQIDALEALTLGLLKSETYQTDLVKAGQKAKEIADESGADAGAAVQAEMNVAAWDKFLNDGKTPHFALVRNLRNIILNAPNFVSIAAEKVSDKKRVQRSLVMPFEYLKALIEIEKMSSDSLTRTIVGAISNGLDATFDNIPAFWGETLVVLDESSSMTGEKATKQMSVAKIGGLFAAAIAKKNNADLLTFATSAGFRTYNPNDSISTIVNSLQFNGGGTDFHSIFPALKKRYDRIIILSDMQGWAGENSNVGRAFADYKRRTGANPFLYSWDLSGYGTAQFPAEKQITLAGFASDIIDLIQKGETNPTALVDEIKALNFADYLGKRPKKQKSQAAR